jgi:hypothetical protein
MNLAAATAVFMAAFLSTGSPFLAVFYTIFAWVCTVTASFLYWIWWFFEKIKNVPKVIRFGFVLVMLFLLVLNWMIILSSLSFMAQIIRSG